MNENQIDKFLRATRPQVKDNPTFLLETRQKMRQLEGIKAEVDRQRSYGRTVIIVTLILGIFIGTLASAFAWLYPVNPANMGKGLWESIRLFLDTWKPYLMAPIAGCAIVLGIVLGKGRRQDFRDTVWDIKQQNRF